MYKPGSRAHFHAMLFNKAYTRLLRSLEKAFNGNPNQIIDAIGMMFSVELHLKNLIRTPIDDNGNPEIGPNAGPTFEFTPEWQKNKQQATQKTSRSTMFTVVVSPFYRVTSNRAFYLVIWHVYINDKDHTSTLQIKNTSESDPHSYEAT